MVIGRFDTDNKGEFLIVRDSSGPNWNWNGNFLIRRRTYNSTCFLETLGITPLVKETTNPAPPTASKAESSIIANACLKVRAQKSAETLLK